MKPLLIAAALLLSCLQGAWAQSLDALNIQFHGYATQAFLYTNHNSWNTTGSENGSAAWTEAVVNLSAQPDAKLHIAVQARYFVLGSLSNQFMLDYAQGDYKYNDRFGIRFGKVKTPVGLLNESQDIDPAQLWVLLPQSVYPIASRDAILSHYGAVVYGNLPLGETLGKIEYRGFVGERVIDGNDGYFQPLRDQGITVPHGISGHTGGGTLRYVPPIRGLLVGASEASGVPSGELAAGPYPGKLTVSRFREYGLFTRYEHHRFVFAAEYNRFLGIGEYTIPGILDSPYASDQRAWYAMATVKLTARLSGGLYNSSLLDHRAAFTSAGARYEKDWALAARYDFNPFLYGKAEQHWIDGTAIGFAASDNPNLQPTTRMTMLKLGVSF